MWVPNRSLATFNTIKNIFFARTAKFFWSLLFPDILPIFSFFCLFFFKTYFDVLWATKMSSIVPKLCHDIQTISFRCFSDIWSIKTEFLQLKSEYEMVSPSLVTQQLATDRTHQRCCKPVRWQKCMSTFSIDCLTTI